MAFTDDDLYMTLRTDGILLGGTFEKGEWSLTVNVILASDQWQDGPRNRPLLA